MRNMTKSKAPPTATSPKADRQPKLWPSHVVSGTPTRLAAASPNMTRPIACARWEGGAMAAATIEAVP